MTRLICFIILWLFSYNAYASNTMTIPVRSVSFASSESTVQMLQAVYGCISNTKVFKDDNVFVLTAFEGEDGIIATIDIYDTTMLSTITDIKGYFYWNGYTIFVSGNDTMNLLGLFYDEKPTIDVAIKIRCQYPIEFEIYDPVEWIFLILNQSSEKSVILIHGYPYDI